MDAPIFDHPLALDTRDICKADGSSEVVCTAEDFNKPSESVEIQGDMKLSVSVINYSHEQLWLNLSYECIQVLTCSRSLEKFEKPISSEFKALVKFSNSVKSWKYVIDQDDEPYLALNDLAKSFSVFEFVRQDILLNKPMNPVKNPEEPFIWGEPAEKEEKIDPRWAKLLELRNKIDKE